MASGDIIRDADGSAARVRSCQASTQAIFSHYEGKHLTEASDDAAGRLAQLPERDAVTTRTMVFYGLGQTGAQFFRDAPAVLLPVFLTTILGVAPWMAGTVILVAKGWVIVSDPLMGALSDRIKGSHGRRPFLAGGAVLTSLTFIALFVFSDYPAPWVAAVTVGLLFFVATTAFSAFSVPYLALASELSNDPHERTRILTFRMVFAVAGVVLGVGLAQPLVFQLGGGAVAWRTMACVMGAICLVAMLGTAYGVPQKRDLSVSAAPRRFLGRISTLWHCKPFVFLTATFFLQSLAQGTGTGVLGFVFIYAVEDTDLLIPFILIMAASTLATQPLWLSASIRWGKEPVFVAGCLLWIANALSWLLLQPGNDVLVELPFLGALSSQDALVLLRGSLVGVSTGGFLLLSLSMLTDAIESQRLRDGAVDEGLFSGVFSAFEKLSYAVGPMISGIVLSIVGFQASTQGAIAQGPEAVRGILLLFSVIPAVIFALGLAVFALYRKALAEAVIQAGPPVHSSR